MLAVISGLVGLAGIGAYVAAVVGPEHNVARAVTNADTILNLEMRPRIDIERAVQSSAVGPWGRGAIGVALAVL
jgi:hypothetical protein